MSFSRRNFLRIAGGVAFLSTIEAHGMVRARNASYSARPSVCLFSKHLGWIKDYSQLAKTLSELGFDGVDLTVRPGGHVSPEQVEQDLPRAFAALKKAGVPIAMITTRVQDPRDPLTRKILRTASSLGIRHYRRDGEKWEGATDPLKRIAELQTQIRELVELNQQYGLFAGIHNHSG